MPPPGASALARGARIARAVAGTALARRSSPLAVARRARELRARGFSLREVELWNLLDPAMPAEELAAYASRREVYALEDRLNPESFRTVADHKALFQRLCDWRGLPMPRLLALYRRDAPGWTPDGAAPRGREEWTRLLAGLAGDIVVKPAWGHLGKGVVVLARRGAGFAGPDGRVLSPAAVHDLMASDPDWPEWLVQERVLNHPELRRLSGTDAVQTVRVLSLLGPDGEVRVLWAMLRAVMGDAQVDNWRDGTTGNALVPVDLETGRLGAAVAPGPDGRATVRYAAHPRTGVPFEGFALPLWQESLALVRRAAPELAPLRALGWDVVIGPDGPLLLEIQARWGPLNPGGGMPSIMAALRAALGEPG